MKNSNSIVPIIVPFQSVELLLIDVRGTPFVPMKPLVEGMGVNWKSHRGKLGSGQFGKLITRIGVRPLGGKRRLMLCLPLRKVLGWLMTMDVANARPDVQRSILAFQKDCDDSLWQCWLLTRPQREIASIHEDMVDELASEYLASYREAIAVGGKDVPRLDAAIESRTATKLATLLLRDKRWLVTFNPSGEPHLWVVPPEAGIFTPERILNWVRERDGAYLSFMPELLQAIGDRLKIA